MPDRSPARWRLLKLFHLHPGFKGCGEGVCRQVSLPFFFSEFTALRAGLCWCKFRAEHDPSSVSPFCWRATLSIDVRPPASCRNLCPFPSTSSAAFRLALGIPQGAKALPHLFIRPTQLLGEEMRNCFCFCKLLWRGISWYYYYSFFIIIILRLMESETFIRDLS